MFRDKNVQQKMLENAITKVVQERINLVLDQFYKDLQGYVKKLVEEELVNVRSNKGNN